MTSPTPAPIIDGFSLNPYTVPLPYIFFSGALAQMDTLRRAKTYRPKWYSVPDDFLNQSVPAYSTVEYQIRVTPGAYLWGSRFQYYYPYGGLFGNPDRYPASSIVVQVTEVVTGIPLFREFASAGIWDQTNAVVSSQARGISVPCLMTQPRLMLEPGAIDIEMCNMTSTALRCLLVLYFAEPVDIVTVQGDGQGG